MNHWFAVQVLTQYDRLAGKCIAELGFEVFAPQRESSTRDGKSPLFPGYLFAAFDLNDANWGRIMNALGVVRILGTERRSEYPQPVPLRAGFVEGLRAYIQRLGGVLPRPPLPTPVPLQPGQRVRVEEGPFAGYEVLVNADEGERVRILLDILGCSVLTLLPRAAISEVRQAYHPWRAMRWQQQRLATTI